MQGRARVLHVDIASSTGAEIAGIAAVRGIPTLIVYDGQGQPVLRQVGRLSKQSVVDLIARLIGETVSSKNNR